MELLVNFEGSVDTSAVYDKKHDCCEFECRCALPCPLITRAHRYSQDDDEGE